ncbi:MAG: phosphoribosylglycinamide formyltransferase [Porphyromonadaceae bacterium]|nr:MAG: phosphoribosylglycinamide formyltransferase [Porphyromonadaceae bacterium]
MSNIAIFASGSGSNAEQIIRYFSRDANHSVKCVLSNKADAYVLERAKNLSVPVMVFNRNTFYNTRQVLDVLNEAAIDVLVLAGFLWLVPDYLLITFPRRIINIHPALLPDFGGKGMYGMRVHEAVIREGRKKSGITIHLIDEEYDRGKILFQAECPVLPNDTPEDLASRIHQLEHRYYPETIKNYLQSL